MSELVKGTVEQIADAVAEWKVEDEKFVAGNNAAGTRARKALQEISRLVKVRRGEISEEKTIRKEEKDS
jgi:hypothetical protein